MQNKKTVFICGLHRSGTSVLHRIIRSSDEITGIENTDAPEDEGQHLQTVFETARAYGGPGKFAMDDRAYLDENSPLVNEANKVTLEQEWGKYWESHKPIRIEKSPPNLIRTRFFQAMFDDACFITITRHPLVVSMATRRKFTQTSLDALLAHWIRAHEIYLADRQHLKREIGFSYEEIIANPSGILKRLEDFLETPIRYDGQLKNSNKRYFDRWNNIPWYKPHRRLEKSRLIRKYESRLNALGYSLIHLDRHPTGGLPDHTTS